MTTTVDCYFLTPDGDPLANATVEFQPVRSGYQEEVDGILMPQLYEATTDVNGMVTVELFPSPIPYCVYVATEDASLSYRILVPVSDLTHRLQDLIIEGDLSDTVWDTEAIITINAAKADAIAAASAAAASADAAAASALAAAASALAAEAAADAAEAALAALLAARCVIQLAASDETTALTAGTNKIRFRMPYAMSNVTVRASLTTAQASGSIFTVDINEAGVSILSTKLTIDNTEKTSVTAATPAVVSDTSLADDAEISVDIDQIGDGTATGLKIIISGTPT